MSLEWPDEWERRAIAENEFRQYNRAALSEWAVQERAADFETWPTILDGYVEWLAEEEGIGFEDAMAHAIYMPEGVAEMKEWARAHAPADVSLSASPAAVVGLIATYYPGGVEGWRGRPRATEPVPLLRRLMRAVRQLPRSVGASAGHRDP